jgi:hypothetical protein
MISKIATFRVWIAILLCVCALAAAGMDPFDDPKLLRGRAARSVRVSSIGEMVFDCPTEWQRSTIVSNELAFADASRGTHHAYLWAVLPPIVDLHVVSEIHDWVWEIPERSSDAPLSVSAGRSPPLLPA